MINFKVRVLDNQLKGTSDPMIKTVIRQIETKNEKKSISEKILRALPNWFGIEKETLNYIRHAQEMPMLTAFRDEKIAGFASLKVHNSSTGEIYVMGVLPECQWSGIGKILIQACEHFLSLQKLQFMTVKTLGPSREDQFYARTRRFYERMGFHRLEEFKSLWGEGNPCLFMVKPLEKN